MLGFSYNNESKWHLKATRGVSPSDVLVGHVHQKEHLLGYLFGYFIFGLVIFLVIFAGNIFVL